MKSKAGQWFSGEQASACAAYNEERQFEETGYVGQTAGCKTNFAPMFERSFKLQM